MIKNAHFCSSLGKTVYDEVCRWSKNDAHVVVECPLYIKLLWLDWYVGVIKYLMILQNHLTKWKYKTHIIKIISAWETKSNLRKIIIMQGPILLLNLNRWEDSFIGIFIVSGWPKELKIGWRICSWDWEEIHRNGS